MFNPIIQGYSGDIMKGTDDFSVLTRTAAAKMAGVSDLNYLTDRQVEAFLNVVDTNKATADAMPGCSVADIRAYAKAKSNEESGLLGQVYKSRDQMVLEQDRWMPPTHNPDGSALTPEQDKAATASVEDNKKAIRQEADVKAQPYAVSANFYDGLSKSADDKHKCGYPSSSNLANIYLSQGHIDPKDVAPRGP